MRVLISGAAGFIGSHLSDLLLADGARVVGVDNFVTGRTENVAHLRHNPRFELIHHDVTEPLKIDGSIDQIFHLASPASPVAYDKMRIATMKVNSQGTWNLLDLALEKNARFLVASTSEIYGDPAVHPQREEYWGNVNPIGLRSMYEEAKRFSEACTMAYHRERQADTRIIRIFNTYGPRMGLHDGRVITNFIRQAVHHEPITVFGDGTQTRSLCFVSDLVRGIKAVMEADFHEPINLGNPEDVTIVQLARDILSLVPGTRSRIDFKPSPAYDPRLRKPDLSRARQILGWSPVVSRKEGLEQIVRYYLEAIQPK
ncbi:MAG: SDR family oxidoreductase [Phycisphaerales bacterium]|nr:SDR family oxidoreductase [Phycisphaerales bacterium]